MGRGAGRRFALVLLALSLVLRLGYVLYEPGLEPAFAHPGLDAGYYLDWARALASGGGGSQGAFYLAPLYPSLLALFFRIFGESLVAVLLLQQLAVLAAALLIGALTSRRQGAWAGLASAGLLLLYQPLLFFSARFVGEATALLLLVLALALALRERARCAFLSGLVSGLAGLARPNLLLCPLAWGALDAARRRFRHAALLGAGVSLAVLPVAFRNFAASGHPVAVSSNGGLTLYHGNGPGALGIFNPPDGFSGELARQRDEATQLARSKTGRPLDPVEADRFWGREAMRVRLADPWGTLQLALRRVLLLGDSYEHGLDEAPMLDRNPFRLTLHLPFPGPRAPGAAANEIPLVPFGLLLGLSVAALRLRGFEATGGAKLWTAAAACAVTPLVFYASSRYRLPLAALLCIPAGVGAAALFSRTVAARERAQAAALAGGCAVLSLLVPFHALRRAEEAAALANRAAAYRAAGNAVAAEREARRAVATDPEATGARFALGLVLERSGKEREAEMEYREAVRLDPGQAEAAGNLAGLLIRRGEARSAVPILRRALETRPAHAVCWTNLVVALAAEDDLAAARAAAASALGAGVSIDPELSRTIGAKDAGGTER